MTFSISWLDFSEEERRRMIQVVSLFKQRDTRDELGFTQIRDGFAGLFFPGTTTIMTRARYFLFVPWMYRYFEQRKVPSSKIRGRVRKFEIHLIKDLMKSGEEAGVIGKRSGASLQRFPSSIYWNGLDTWGILKYRGYQFQYQRSLDGFYNRMRNQPQLESAEVVGDIPANWDNNLPKIPSNFPKGATFELTIEDAIYLKERLLLSSGDSLLAYMVDRCQPEEDVPFAWLHPQLDEFPPDLQNKLSHARNFAETMQGAALLYNLMLAEKTEIEEWIEEYQEWIRDWYEEILMRENVLVHWDRGEFWNLTDSFGSVYYPTRRFVENWLDLLMENNRVNNPIDVDEFRRVVYDREVWLKKGRSRLVNPRQLELWGGAAGTGKLNFRWGIGNRIALDIQQGLQGS